MVYLTDLNAVHELELIACNGGIKIEGLDDPHQVRQLLHSTIVTLVGHVGSVFAPAHIRSEALVRMSGCVCDACEGGGYKYSVCEGCPKLNPLHSCSENTCIKCPICNGTRKTTILAEWVKRWEVKDGA